MKRDDLKLLRDKSVDELQAEVVTLREELLKGRFSQALEGTGLGVQARAKRRQVARLMTIINQKKAEVQA